MDGQSHSRPASETHGTVAAGGKMSVDTIWKACAFGDADLLRDFLHRSPELVDRPDDQGYYPLQWAALNNRVGIASYLLENGCVIDRADSQGQTALHWAAVRGSLSAAETLLRASADLTLADSKGYTVCHVAAQYGQTAFLYHVALRWGADIDCLDSDGRAPLHWAAYKGYADTVRLLLVMNACMSLPDKEGCTPLHWGAIRGNGEACTLLLQAGAEGLLTVRDETGSTPAQLAVSKGHRPLGVYLADWRRKVEQQDSCTSKGRPLAFLTATSLCPLVWLYIIFMLVIFIRQVMHHHGFFALAPSMAALAWLGVLLAVGGLGLLYCTTTSDPGFIPQGATAPARAGHRGTEGRKSTPTGGSGGQRHPQYAQLDSPALWAGAWNQLCVTCRIVRPLRAKHCAVSDRCVHMFDHFCPWVGNTIGMRNRCLFLAFLWTEFAAMLLVAWVAVVRIRHVARRHGPNPSAGLGWVLGFIMSDLFVIIGVAALAVTQASQVGKNITTNELANWTRYKYLRGTDGTFHNPFDQGFKSNCIDVWYPDTAPLPPVAMDTSTSTMSLLKMEQGQQHLHDLSDCMH